MGLFDGSKLVDTLPLINVCMQWPALERRHACGGNDVAKSWRRVPNSLVEWFDSGPDRLRAENLRKLIWTKGWKRADQISIFLQFVTWNEFIFALTMDVEPGRAGKKFGFTRKQKRKIAKLPSELRDDDQPFMAFDCLNDDVQGASEEIQEWDKEHLQEHLHMMRAEFGTYIVFKYSIGSFDSTYVLLLNVVGFFYIPIFVPVCMPPCMIGHFLWIW